MKRTSRRLPPLNSVRAFEAAARHKSISLAAKELLVTHGAVSKQVRLLERFLGEELFERSPTGLTLTSAGIELAGTLSPIFEDLRRVFNAYDSPRRTRNTCRLSTVPSFAAQFLIPRLRRFHESNPEINLQILTSLRLVDFERENIDIAIRFGSGDWKGAVCDPLGGRLLIPVCAAAIAEKHRTEDVAAILASTALIHRDSTADWMAWLEMAGLPHIDSHSGLVMQDNYVAIKATLEGQGVCLLPQLLVQSELASGALRRISKLELETGRQYFLVRPVHAEQRPCNRRVMDWIRSEVRFAADEVLAAG